MSKFKPYLSDSKGMTVIEVLVSTIIIGIMAGLALPAVNSSMAKYRLRNTANQLRSEIRFVQQMAVSQRTPSHVNLYLEGDTPSNMYLLKKGYSNIKRVDLPEGISFKKTTFKNSKMSFSTMGNLGTDGGGTVLLENEQGDQLYVIVVSPTGRVRIDNKPPLSWLE